MRFEFLDVELKEANAQELRNRYENRKFNFPTITIGEKKLTCIIHGFRYEK